MMTTEKDNKRNSSRKSLEEQIETTRSRLNKLQYKSKADAKKKKDKERVNFSIQIEKALNCDVLEIDRELILGLLLDSSLLHEDDKIQYKVSGRIFLSTLKRK